MKRLSPMIVAVLSLLWLPPSGLAEVIPRGRFGIGDSIMLSSWDELVAYAWSLDAEVGRQFETSVRIVRRRAARGTLPKRVIVHLGTNGPIDATACDQLVAAAGPRRRVFLVTVKVPRGWQDTNNQILRACAAAYEKVHLVGWFARSSRHPEWFATDGYHVNADGQDAFASFLQRRVDAILSAMRAG